MAYIKLLAPWVIVSIKISISESGGCGHPDIPEGGFYSPVQEEYNVGDSVDYTCRSGLLLKGKIRNSCNSNGEWQNSVPFCDSPAKLKNPTSTTKSYNSSYYINRTTDNDTRTCFKAASNSGTTVKVFLEEPSPVYRVRMFFPKGFVNINVALQKGKPEIEPVSYNCNLDNNQWVDLEFVNPEISTSICITDARDKRNEFEICEIEVYTKSELWCEKPPEQNVNHGYLVVGREKATLNCAKGFIPGNKFRLVCDSRRSWSKTALECKDILCHPLDQDNMKGGSWITSGKGSKLSIGVTKTLKCHPGYTLEGSPSKITCRQNGTWTYSAAKCTGDKNDNEKKKYYRIILGTSITAGLLILSCFIVVICLIFKKSAKPVVVVLKPGEDVCHSNYSTPSSPNVAEYSTINYDYIDSTSSRTSPKPPDLLMEYSSPMNQLRKDTTKKKRTELKSSSLYGK